MNILTVGGDDSVFQSTPQTSNTTQRLGQYLDALCEIAPGSTLTAFVSTRANRQTLIARPGLTFIPVKTRFTLFFPLNGWRAASQMRDSIQPPDIISAQNPYESGLLAWMLSRSFKARLEIQVHLNLFSPYWLAEKPLLNRMRFALARQVIQRADAIRVVSSTVKDELIRQWGIPAGRIAVIPIPVWYEKDIPAISVDNNLSNPQAQVVLFVGRLHPSKNLDGLFNVCTAVLKNRADAEFVFIGDGPQRAHAQQRAGEIAPYRIHILGNIPYNHLPAWYRRAQLVVLSSLHEGFARVLVESYLFSTPAVSTRCGGPQDIILDGETGFLTPIENMDEFAQRVAWLLENPDAASRMGERGRQYIETHFDPALLTNRIVGQWQRLFNRL